MTRFFIAGKPVPQARARVTRRGTYTPRSSVAWQERVRLAFRQACKGVFYPAGTPLRFTAEVVCSGRGPRARIRGDLDNYAKGLKDALNSVAYVDDIQIVELIVTKRRAGKTEATGAYVTIEALGESCTPPKAKAASTAELRAGCSLAAKSR